MGIVMPIEAVPIGATGSANRDEAPRFRLDRGDQDWYRTTMTIAIDAFVEFPKLARLSREAIVSEKLDGTNSCVFIWDVMHPILPGNGELQPLQAGDPPAGIPWVWQDEGIYVAAGSRTKWITPEDDNHGFAKWVAANVEQLVYLRHGRHFGEWWGSGIQRGYGLTKGEKRWSLFNVARWCLHGQTPQRIPTADPRVERYQDVLPACCGLVPVLYRGVFTTDACETALEGLRANGSVAAPGYRNPEGIVCFHVAANMGFKKTLVKDDVPKGVAPLGVS